ncbi:hypothetical protein [Actinocrispum sp. NPDC049592]|uniref:hypothetical protein n=1 Tax=Actinocrispum sp. NPDC049592 TaxID=3154835 RepID=UPI0034223958
MWICVVVLLGLSAVAARLRRRRYRPRATARPVRPRPPAPSCVVIVGSRFGTHTRRTDRKPQPRHYRAPAARR